MSDSTQHIPPIPAQLSCIGCGYDVKGLPPHDPCPECSLPIWRSYMGSDLAHAPASYRATLCNGAFLVAGATMLHLLFFAGLAIVIVMDEYGFKGIPPTHQRPWYFPFYFFIPNTLGFFGYFLLSTPNPAITITESRWSPRRLLRLTLALQTIGLVLQLSIASAAYAANFYANRPTAQLIGGSFAFASNLFVFFAWIVQLFAAINLCAVLAQRIPDEKLATWVRSLRWKIPLWTIPGLALGIGPFVAIGYYITMLIRLRSRIRALRDPSPNLTP